MATASRSISQSTAVMVAANVIGAIWIGFGVFDLIDPEQGLTFFEFKPPMIPAERAMVNSLVNVIGIRDIFIGFAIHATAFFGNRTALGWILLGSSVEAFLDGVVCYSHGKGEWNHWGYAPMLTIVGLLLLGVMDGKKTQR
jgi:uncharacterized membrane protein